MKITKEQFEAYKSVRVSGVTNMFNVKVVEAISGLDREIIFKIMDNYTKLNKKYTKEIQ